MGDNTIRILLTYPITARTYWFGDKCLAAMREVAEVVLNPKERILTSDELATLGAGCSALVVDRLTRIDSGTFSLMPNLIAAIRGGVDHRHINVADASSFGVLVTQVEAAYQAGVAELALGLILDAARSISAYSAQYRAGDVPRPHKGRQIAGSTVGIIGFGRVARHLAQVLRTLGANIVAHDPFADTGSEVANLPLADLMQQSDFVVPLAVSAPSTYHMINREAFAQMRRDAWLINVSRGDLVDEAALEDALDRGLIAGVGMDVGNAEDQMPSPHLALRANVIATPHVGGITQESFENHAMQTVAQVKAIAEGRMPPGVLNAEAGHRFRAMRLRRQA